MLQHLLTNGENKRIAVIVNDMAEVNIDAALVRDQSVVRQRDEQMVQLENGCICCTLRADLLDEVAKLARQQSFDYCIIESTGISEPMQVAETFAMTESDIGELVAQVDGEAGDEQRLDALKSLVGLARLDTCVTVVDAANFFDTFEESRVLSEKFDDVDPDDERNIVDLMVDQLEFANVIVINKVDLVTSKQLGKVRAVIAKLNPAATLYETSRSRVPLDTVLDTSLFNMDDATQAAGWLQSLREELKPESLEYGVGSFVFRAERPFHPQRLHAMLCDNFMLEEYGMDAPDDIDADATMLEDEGARSKRDHDGNDAGDNITSVDGEDDDDDESVDERPMLVAKKKAGVFGPVLRSKGFLWLATRNDIIGAWSQAGAVLNIAAEMPWFAAIAESEWPEGAAGAAIRAEVQRGGKHGDRRQEIVFIGIDIDQTAVTNKLTSCLVTDEEWNDAAEAMQDPFAPWPLLEDFTGDDDDENDHTHCEH